MKRTPTSSSRPTSPRHLWSKEEGGRSPDPHLRQTRKRRHFLSGRGKGLDWTGTGIVEHRGCNGVCAFEEPWRKVPQLLLHPLAKAPSPPQHHQSPPPRPVCPAA
uniref:Uncharacterized protein n=1 Tax=Knipowitschia caucasica TaxID=637954 RepID=A0AAV2KJZ9_KNICA